LLSLCTDNERSTRNFSTKAFTKSGL
jgi:hypothetical protein